MLACPKCSGDLSREGCEAVGGGDNVAAEFVRGRGAGVVANEPAEIAEHLRGWLRQKSEAGAIPALPDEAAAGVTREEQARVLEEFLSRTLAAARGGVTA